MTWESEQKLPKLDGVESGAVVKTPRRRRNAPGPTPEARFRMQKNRSLAPRAYGEETDRGYEKAMDAHTDQLAFARTDRWRTWVDRYSTISAEELARAEGSQGADEWYKDIHLAHVLAANFLRDAEPFYVAADVCDLLEAARHDLPSVELRESDLLVPNGFVWLEHPIANFLDADGGAALDGFAWASWEYKGRKNALATSFCAGYPGVVEVAFPGAGESADYEFPIAKLLVAFWLLSQQRLFVKNARSPSRAVRRRAKDRKIQAVTVVSLRRTSYPETDGSRRVDWSHRWLTRGHWRNQWYPSEGRHKPVWVASYVKGPADKPFVAKRRAFEFKR